MSRQPRKQRKLLYTAPLHKRRKWIAAHLADDLILKYKRRSLPVIKGDTVKVMRGDFKGYVGKVRSVDTKKGRLEVEGVVITKVDGKKVPRPVHASNVVITKLNLTDPWRRKKLEEGLPEEVKKEIEKEAEEQIKELAEEEAMAEEKITEEVEEEKEEVAEEAKEEKEEEEVTEEGEEEAGEEAEEEAKEEAKDLKEKKDGE